MTGETKSDIPDTPESYATVKEVARELRVSERTVLRSIRDGRLRSVQFGGRGCAHRIRVADLEAFLSRKA